MRSGAFKGHRLKSSLALLCGFLVCQTGIGRADYCRSVWADYKHWDLSPGEHKVFAVHGYRSYPVMCYWWRSNSVETSSSNALAKCNSWQADSCEVVDVDGVPKRPGLDAFFARSSFTRVDIEIFYGPSNNLQKISGFLIMDYPDSGKVVKARLISSDKKSICEGSYTYTVSDRFHVNGLCFHKYEFSDDVVATGVRYIDGTKVGYNFEATFKYEASYIHIRSSG